MNKLVYLHELDSVRNTTEEILRGQQAMYQEIVMNGNCVVLTYNQFTDSKAFLCSVKNEEQYKYILELFQKGYIKLSNFVMKDFGEDEKGNPWTKEFDIYTPSQYIQHALDKNIKGEGKFIFSGIDLKLDEIELMTVMRDALKYSNTAVFDTYEPKSKEDEARVLELIKYTRMLLAISVEELAYNPIKRENKISFQELMTSILKENWNGCFAQDAAFGELFSKSVEILKNVETQIPKDKINARSNWLNILYERNKLPEVELAEGIVHLVYNYVVEDSIADVAKHYDNSNGMGGLIADFVHRIKIYWTEHIEEGLHDIHKPKNGAEGAEWDKILSWKDFPDWETAARVVEKNTCIKPLKKEDMANTIENPLYEENYDSDRKKWKKKLAKTILLQIVIAFIYIILIHIFNELTSGVESTVDFVLGMLGMDLHPVLSALVNLIIYTVLLGVFSSSISKKLNLPDILESIDDIGNGFADIKNVRSARKYVSYVWLKEKDNANE